MMTLRNIGSLFALNLATLLMGQASGCPDLNSLMPKIDSIFASNSSTNKIYIANLSFLDADSKSVMPAGDAELINEAVDDGMKTLSTQNPKYVINDPAHRLENNDANALNLSNIYWDANLSRTAKVDKIIAELMEPSKIDGLVFGQFQQQKDEITVRPIVISRASKNLLTETKKFTVNEFNCTDANNPARKVLCPKTAEEIRDIVVRLLSQT